MFRSTMLRKIFAAIFFCVFSGTSFAAANVLYLSTDEATHGDALIAVNNVLKEFRDAGATVVFNDTEFSNGTAMNPAIFTVPGGGSYDVVIITSAYESIDALDWPVIKTAIETRKANSFLFFVEDSSGPQVRSLLSDASGWTVGTGANVNTWQNQPLNTGSPYSGSFSTGGLTNFYAGLFNYLSGIPADYALFLPAGSGPVSGGAITPAFGAILPAPKSFSGTGACIFLTIDMSGFDVNGYPVNKDKVGPAFLNAATAQGGACGLPASVTKAFSSASVSPGDTSTLTITVANLTFPQSTVSGLNVTDNLPAPLQISGTPTTTCTGGNLTGAVGGNSVQLSGAILPTNGCTITVPVTWPNTPAAINACTGAAVTNTIIPGTGFTTAGGQVNTPATATLTCNAGGPIAVTKVASSTTVVPGGSLSYTITVTNTGANAASNVVITDTVPTEITGATWTCAGTVGASCPNASGSGNISETVTSLPGGGVLTYVMAGTVVANPGPSFTNTVSVDPGNALCANSITRPCTASAHVPPVGMIGITKTTSTSQVVPGGTIDYEIIVTNTGSVAATSIVVSDPTPTGVASGTWTCTGTCGAASGALPLSDTIASLAAADTATYAIQATVDSTPSVASITNTASATLGNGGVCTGGVTPPCNSAVTTTQVMVGTIGITKTTSTPQVAPGGTIDYEITVTNTGSFAAATSIVVSDPTPTGVVSGTWTCTGTCGAASGTLPLSDTIASLAVGGTATYAIQAIVDSNPSVTAITNTASATLGNSGVCTGGAAPPCNSAPATTQVAWPPPPQPSIPVPIPAWLAFAMAAMLLGAGRLAKCRRSV